MAKPNAKTLQERMGFTDADLKTPGHDAIMLWLDDTIPAELTRWLGLEQWDHDELALAHQMPIAWREYGRQCQEVVDRCTNRLGQAEKDLDHYTNERPDLDMLKNRAAREIEDCRRSLLMARQKDEKAQQPREFPPIPAKPLLQVVKKTWEEPVTTGRDYTVGFVDMSVDFRWPSLSFDPAPQLTWRIGWYEGRAYFEVKTTIPSLGELLRQLTHYRQHLYQSWDFEKARIFVVSPDARFADKIREQGYGFIQSPGAKPTVNGQAKDDRWLFGR